MMGLMMELMHGNVWSGVWIDEEELQKRGEALFVHAKFADDANWRRELEKFTLWRES